MRAKNFIKRTIIQLSGKKSHLKKGISCDYKWYGHYHGSLGFNLCPTLLNEKSIVYSFGIGEDISFDNEVIERHQCKVYGFDPTPRSIDWIKNQDISNLFHFQDYGIAEKTGVIEFFLPKNEEHVSGSMALPKHLNPSDYIEVQMKSLKDIIIELKHDKIDVLKMDIEGGEYEVINSILDSGVIIDQLLIEFHEHFFDDGKDKTIAALNKLKGEGYEIYAISDTFNEISFIRKELV